MKTPLSALFARVRLWLPPVVFLLANLALALFDRAVLATRSEALAENVRVASEELAGLAAERQRLGEREAQVRSAQLAARRLFDGWFARPEERLTAAIAEVKELARRAGLEIRALNYPSEQLVAYDLSRRAFVFGVEGTYAELRQLVYLIELTPSFLTLEQLSVGEAAEGGRLRADLRLSTLFVAEPSADNEARPSSRRPRGRS